MKRCAEAAAATAEDVRRMWRDFAKGGRCVGGNGGRCVDNGGRFNFSLLRLCVGDVDDMAGDASWKILCPGVSPMHMLAGVERHIWDST